MVKETAKVRELRDIWSDQPALWKIKVAMSLISSSGEMKNPKFYMRRESRRFELENWADVAIPDLHVTASTKYGTALNKHSFYLIDSH